MGSSEVGAFVSGLAKRGKGLSTQRAYRNDLRQFETWLYAREMNIIEAGETEIGLYLTRPS